MRLITRSDFDGLACAALLEYLGLIDEWLFVHPKDIQDGLIEATKNDVVVNVPYIKGCGLWFDHHSSEDERLGIFKFEGASRQAPSCARVVYDYFGGEDKFSPFAEMIKYADKLDSADLTIDEIMNPSGWVLLGFIVDPRTGLGRIQNFTTSNLDLVKQLAKNNTFTRPIGEILALSDVQERVDAYFEQHNKFIEMVKKYARAEGRAIFADLRNVETILAGNRFLLYTLFPEQNISVWVMDGKKNVNSVITVGYSIINKSASVDVGSLMLKYGGGGHRAVGSCQVACEDTDRIMREIVDLVK